jgi:ketosteroid isomerase-like protein
MIGAKESKPIDMNAQGTDILKITADREEGVRRKDVAMATANYADDVIIFDVVDPLERQGIGEVRRRLKEWLSTLSEIRRFEIKNVSLHISSDLAYATSMNHIDALNVGGERLNMWWRETTCYARISGAWKITHAHSSVPFNPENGKPSIGLLPDAIRSEAIQH